MNQLSKGWIIIIAVLVIGLVYTGITYNRLVKLDENVKLTWGDLQNSYQRRLDLTPNLVTVVKASSDFERQTLEQLAAARAKAQQVTINSAGASPDNYKMQEQAQGEMVLSINRVIGVIEKYPDLQTTKSFVNLQAQLTGTERRIRVSRDDFNASVAGYNKLARGFPSGMVASLLGFKSKEGFQSDTGAETPPEVKF